MSDITASIAATMRHPVLVLDREHAVVLANPAFCELFRVPAGETAGVPLAAFAEGRWEAAGLCRQLAELRDSRGAIEGLRVEGDFAPVGRRSMLVNARYLEGAGADGGDRILLAIEDITEQKQSMEVSRRSEERLAAIFEHAPIGLGVMDREGYWLHLNARMRRFMGPRLPSRDSAVAHRWRGFDTEGRPLEPSQYPGARALRGEALPPPVDFLTDVTGEPRWVRFRAVPLPTGDGGVEEAIASLQDITEEKRTLEALRENEERLRESEERPAAALRAGKLGVHDFDPQSGHVEWDALVRSLWGIPGDEEITYAAFLAGVHPDDVPHVEKAIADALDPAGAHFYQAEYRVIHRETGEVRWVRADGTVTFENGAPVRLVGTVADITDRKQTEQQSEFLAHELAHRVKNTLGIVQSLAMATGAYARSTEDYQQVFLGRLNALARTQSLLMEANWESADLEDLVAQSIEAFYVGHPEVAELAGEPLTLSARQALGLSLVLHELATNAAKYGALSRPEGRLHIAFGVAEGDDGRQVWLEWRERHGPVVTLPETRGFGTELIEGACAYELDGEAHLDYAPEGLTCRIVFPLEEVTGTSVTS